MDATRVKMQSPAKKRAGRVIRRPGQAAKQEATTPPRMTRSMFKKLNENGATPVELNPGLDMGVKRRGPRTTRPPKRPAQDQDVTDGVKQIVTKKRKGAQSQAKESKPGKIEPAKPESAEQEPKEPEHTGPKLAGPQVIESQPVGLQATGPQPAEPQAITAQVSVAVMVAPETTTSQPGDLQKRISKADIAAASRLAQAALAAGLTRATPEPATPVAEDRPRLVRLTKKDLRDILYEVVVEEGTRQRMEPHWLARTEFLTWWERPAADMDHIKEQVRRLAIRWSKDLEARSPDDSSIPTPILESWRADLVILGDPEQDAGGNEAEDEGAKVTEDENPDNYGQVRREEGNNEIGVEGEGSIEAKKQGSDGVDQVEGDDDSSGAAEALGDELMMVMREMADWKEYFDKEIAAQPEFRRRRAWTTVVFESQQEAAALEQSARDLGVYIHKFGLTTDSAQKSAQILLSDLRHFRHKVKMDRAAFSDEFDEEGAEALLEKARSGGNAEGQMEDDTQQDETQTTKAVIEATEPVLKYDGRFLTKRDSEGEAASEPEKGAIQAADIQTSTTDDAPMTDIEDRHDIVVGDGRISGSEIRQAEPLSETANTESEPASIPVGPEHKPEEKSDQHDESASTMTEPLVESDYKVAELHQWRNAERDARENPVGLPRVEEGEEFDASPVSKPQEQGEEGETSEAAQEDPHREPPSCVPEMSGGQSPSPQRPGREQQQQASEAPMLSAAVTAQGQPNPFREARIYIAAHLYKSATIEEARSEGDGTNNQAPTPPDTTGLFTPETSSAASRTRSASPEIITCKSQKEEDDSSSIASRISSLPDDPGSPGPGQSETAEGVGEGDVGGTPPGTHDDIALAEDTSLPQDMNSSVVVISIESTEEVSGTIEEAVEDISPSTHIKRLLEEASMPRDIGASITSEPSRSVEESDGKPGGTAGRSPTPKSPQGTGHRASGIPSGGDVGLEIQVDQAVENGAAPDAAGLPQPSSIGGDIDDPPPARSVHESTIVVPTVRYIKPQWEDAGSLFSPEEPTYSYSANEAEEDDDNEANSIDDKETDDVDP